MEEGDNDDDEKADDLSASPRREVEVEAGTL